MREPEQIIYQGQLKINKAALILALEEVPMSLHPDNLHLGWDRQRYGEGDGTFPDVENDEMPMWLYTFWQGDTQITLGEDRLFHSPESNYKFPVGRIELKVAPNSGNLFTDVSIVCAWSPMRSHYEVMANILRPHEAKKRSKKGPTPTYTDDEKLEALREWDQLDKSQYHIDVKEWLAVKFGVDNDVPNVSKSTFYGWKKPLGYKKDQ